MCDFKLFFLLIFVIGCDSRANITDTPCDIGDVSGTCKSIYRCPYAQNIVKIEQRKPPRCGTENGILIVCCPSENNLYRTGEFKEYFKSSTDGVIKSKDMTCRYNGVQPILCCKSSPDTPIPREPQNCPALVRPKLKSKRQHFAWSKCVEYQRYFNKCISLDEYSQNFDRMNTCGISSNTVRIFGGRPALIREFPHMAVLGVHNSVPTDDVDIIWVGGGSLISERFILTAGHVLVENLHGRLRYAMLGSLSKTDLKSGMLYNIIRLIPHKSYSKGHKKHDIALLELHERVKFNEFVRPACLPVADREIENEMIIAGWGETEGSVRGSEVLLTTTVRENPEPCLRKLDSNNYDAETMICASGSVGSTAHDACKGDSGGPLMALFTNLNCSYSIEGVVSYGPRCGQEAGVYTRVSIYLDWILENVWPNEFSAYKAGDSIFFPTVET